MALMTQQAISSVITPSFSAVNATDTITPDTGLILYVKTAGTSSTVTIVVPGNQPYSGTATTDLVVSMGTTQERVFYLNPSILTDPSTALISVTYSPTTAVTSALLKI